MMGESEEPPPWAKSYGWCQYCTQETGDLTEQVYSPPRRHWMCLRCGVPVVTPERQVELEEITKNITAKDIYG